MRLHRLNSFQGYPEECCHAHEGECSGQITPYIGERDSFGYEVVGYCEHHYKQQLDTVLVCDQCGKETTHLRYCSTLLEEVCPACYSREFEDFDDDDDDDDDDDFDFDDSDDFDDFDN